MYYNKESISSNIISFGTIRNRFHPILFIWINQDLIASNLFFIWINQESISSNLFSYGSIRNQSHPIFSIGSSRSHAIDIINQIFLQLEQSESISSNLFSSGSIRNRSHPIYFHLDQSGIDLLISSHPEQSAIDFI
ncbi:hypothetical protein CEXT_245871 [Caerostris extrusa]|uniref:Maturase K n=1 Tax=Caerostris extrusa TaxID=172846 RepID=A0AAV4ME13_CAEEX|nr:hypothetical protein CEXT_245871 [Caerostris extrusa]